MHNRYENGSKHNQEGFKVIEQFMSREPILSLSFFYNYLAKPLQDNYTIDEQVFYYKSLVNENTVIREAIAISSLTLLKSIESITLNSKNKNKRNVIKGIFRYLNRLSTRSTPFGLCASVGLGEFSDENEVDHVTRTPRKQARADSEWIQNLIRLLEADKQILNGLKIAVNQSVFINGDRAKLNHKTEIVNEQSKDKELIVTSINYNEITELTFAETKNPIVFRTLVSNIYEKYNDVSVEVVEDYIAQLIQQEFLTTELFPPNSVNNLDHILEILIRENSNLPLTDLLIKINHLIKAYEQTELGEGLDLYLEIVNKMNLVTRVKTPLKIDLISKGAPHRLGKKNKKGLEEIANLLCNLNAYNGGYKNQVLKEYHSKFLQVYGLEREVPVIELLEDGIGLGPPGDYQYPPAKNQTSDSSSTNSFGDVDKFFLDLIIESNLKCNREISLNKKHLKEIRKDMTVKEQDLPISMDMYFSEVNEGDKKTKFLLSHNPYAPGAGNTLGRFTPYLEDKEKVYWKDIAKKEQKHFSNSILAEINPTPISERNLNICRIDERRNYSISVTNKVHAKNNIDLDDIVVGATHDELYLKSISMGKEIIPLASHMLNPSLCPNVYRFLVEIGEQRTGRNFPYFFNNINNLGFPFTPRIVYKDFILSSAKWNIRANTFQYCRTEERFVEEFEKYREKYNIDQYVFLVNLDNKILFNLENRDHLSDLFREVRKLEGSSILTLTENLEALDANGVCRENVFFFLNNDIKDTTSVVTRNNSLPTIHSKNRMEYPFDKWIYLKIYCSEDRENELIGKHFYEFIQNNKWFDSFFFMRYRDPDFHLRIRFKASSDTLIHQGLPSIMKWLQKVKSLGIIHKISFDTYDPEIERYGGSKLIDEAENVFHYDSLITLELIKKIHFRKTPLSTDIIAFMNINHYLSCFDYGLFDQLDWLNHRIDYKEWLRDYRLNQEVYDDFLNGLIANNSDQLDFENNLKELLQLRKISLQNYLVSIRKNLKGDLYSTRANILDSLIHMHLNRLVGIDREYETKILTLYRHTIRSLSRRLEMV